MKGSRVVVVGLVLGLALFTSVAEAKWIVVPPRPGQLGVALDGQFGTLIKQGALGDEFDSGSGLSVRLRYRLRYERAIGLSFEHQDYAVRNQADSIYADHKLTLMNSSVEFYQLFGTETRTTKWLSAGAGLTQVSKKLADGEIKLGGDDVTDGAFVTVGAGAERFLVNAFGLDFNVHYKAVFQNNTTNHEISAALGLVFYASY